MSKDGTMYDDDYRDNDQPQQPQGNEGKDRRRGKTTVWLVENIDRDDNETFFDTRRRKEYWVMPTKNILGPMGITQLEVVNHLHRK